MRADKGKYTAAAAVIAALYTALTLLLSPISFNVMQLRFSEGLNVLALYTPSAVPGLLLGCFLANILGPGGITDAVFGSIATLIGCLGIRAFRKKPWIALLSAVISNAIFVGLELRYVFSLEMDPLLCMMWIAIGEFISIYLPALIIKPRIDRSGGKLFH